MTYRPGLDGLRGVAVLLVLANHGQLPGFHRTGLPGVALFFCLSGFLITSLLLEEHSSTGRIDLRAFYARRARRLLPALFAVVAVVSLGMILLGRADEIIGDVIPVLFYHANWRGLGELGFLGHAWSLSIEEQFYLLWPTVLVFVRRGWVIAAAFGVIALRAVLADPGQGIGSTLSVADSLLLGCWLAFRPFHPSFWHLGLALGVLTLWMIAPDVGALGNLQFVPVALTSVVIVAAANDGWLDWWPLVRIGTISYGLYLWHAPLFAYVRDEGLMSAPVAICLGIMSVGIATLSARYIERPLRRARTPWKGEVQARGGDGRVDNPPIAAMPTQ